MSEREPGGRTNQERLDMYQNTVGSSMGNSRQQMFDQKQLENLWRLYNFATDLIRYAAPKDCPELQRREVGKPKTPDNGIVSVSATKEKWLMTCKGKIISTTLHPCNFCAFNEKRGGVTVELKDIDSK